MEVAQFKQLVSRLEQESAAAPRSYRAKVAALTLLGFLILALLFSLVGLGLLLLGGLAVAMLVTGGKALLLLLKLGKVLFLLAVPLWFMVRNGIKALLIRLPAPQGREVTAHEAPALFEALEQMRRRMRGPRFHHVLIVDEVNAAVVQRPAFGLIGWPRNYLLLGLPLLEAMPAREALAVVAHEYGHLSGAHGRFSAFVYRLRHTWGSVQEHIDQFQGWLARLVTPLVRWYAPYFNAYTFVLARADEYQADAASAELVGAAPAAHALKRVNLIAPNHRRFMEQAFERIDHDAAPPQDLTQRWAAQAVLAPPAADAQRWLDDALDREGHYADSHPTLRARLAALPATPEALNEPPPPMGEASAAQAWLGPLAQDLRAEMQAQWAQQVAEPWAERHAQAQQQRERLQELRALTERDADAQIEMLRLALRIEPETDWRADLAAFNAEHKDHPLGLYLEGGLRLDKGERAGVDLLQRAMELDPDAIKPACERVHGFLMEAKDEAAAETFAERWRQRDAFERQREHQIENIDPAHPIVAHGLDEPTLAAVRALLSGKALRAVSEIYLARRIIPVDPDTTQLLLGVRLNWWGSLADQQKEVVNRLVSLEWPVTVTVLTMEDTYEALRQKFRAVPGARLI